MTLTIKNRFTIAFLWIAPLAAAILIPNFVPKDNIMAQIVFGVLGGLLLALYTFISMIIGLVCYYDRVYDNGDGTMSVKFFQKKSDK